ncbi:MAG: IMP dehydrogenase, partial [Nanoarchaeota archaeon]
KWFGKVKNDTPEGKIEYLEIGENVDKLLRRYAGALRSGISYAGGKDIKTFQEDVEFVRLA